MDGAGTYELLQQTRDRVIAANPQARQRILGLPPVYVPAKATRITVDCRTGERTVEQIPVLDSRPKPILTKPYIPPPPRPYEIVKEPKRPATRRFYARMSTEDREAAQKAGRELLGVIKEITGFSIAMLTATERYRSPELAAARTLFFACLQCSVSYISLHELARPLGCDHTIPSNSLHLFPKRREREPFATWLRHPKLDRLRYRLMALK